MAATIGESLETSSGRMFSLIALLYAWTHFVPSFLLIALIALDCAGSETKRNSARMRNRMALVRYLSFWKLGMNDSLVDFLLIKVIRFLPNVSFGDIRVCTVATISMRLVDDLLRHPVSCGPLNGFDCCKVWHQIILEGKQF